MCFSWVQTKLSCILTENRSTAVTERMPVDILHVSVFRITQLACTATIDVASESMDNDTFLLMTSTHKFRRLLSFFRVQHAESCSLS